MQQKSIDFIELGLRPEQIGKPRDARQMPPRLLYAGRLLYWKGVHIAIRAFAHFLPRIPDARLTIVGKGPEQERLKADAAAFSVAQNVDFISWLPQQKLYEIYGNHDLFVFPSLHDSSGHVVIEALSCGLPVVCLDLGGPKEIVTANSGIIVRTGDRNTAEVAAAMADEMVQLVTSPARLSAMSAGAIARAHQFILSDRVLTFYDCATQALGLSDRKTSNDKCGHIQETQFLRSSLRG
jgi:glycosyltransferase involved in cell wall biosynthesis